MGLFESLTGGIFKNRRRDYGETEDPGDTENYGFSSAIERKDYGNQELNFFADTSSSQYLPGIIAMIEEQNHLTEGFKMALEKAVSALLGVDLLLANNNPTQVNGEPFKDNIRINSLEADIILGLLVTNATKSDIEGFDLTGFCRIIKTEHKALQSRTIGSTRERIIMTELRTTMRSISEQVPKEHKQPEKKKGWLGIF